MESGDPTKNTPKIFKIQSKRLRGWYTTMCNTFLHSQPPYGHGCQCTTLCGPWLSLLFAYENLQTISLWQRNLIYLQKKNWQHFLTQQSFANMRRIESSPNLRSRQHYLSLQNTRLESYLRRPLWGRIVANKAYCVCLCRWPLFHRLNSSRRTDRRGHRRKEISSSTKPQTEAKKSICTCQHHWDQGGWYKHIHGDKSFYKCHLPPKH